MMVGNENNLMRDLEHLVLMSRTLGKPLEIRHNSIKLGNLVCDISEVPFSESIGFALGTFIHRLAQSKRYPKN